MPRDPRIDPEAGDVLNRGKSVRTVTNRKQSIVYYLQGKTPTYCLLSKWRTWAKKADYTKQSPGSPLVQAVRATLSTLIADFRATSKHGDCIQALITGLHAVGEDVSMYRQDLETVGRELLHQAAS